MTETDARAVLLVRSLERAAALPADDVSWAGREARRLVGEPSTSAQAGPEAWLAQRAHLALGRLAERDPGLRPALAAVRRPLGAVPVLVLLAGALLLGLLGDSPLGLRPGQPQQINLLALPLLGLLVWNLAVFAMLAWQALRSGAAAVALPLALMQALARWQMAAGGRWAGLRQAAAAAATPVQAALSAFTADWLAHSQPLLAARGRALLHAGAALLALGAVLALYGRGLVLDYQAGWDSTFLQPDQVHSLLAVLLGPASAVAGLPLPPADALAGLRLSAGGGENAAPWIHRWAITLLAGVVLPRALLAALALRQAHALAADMPLPVAIELQRLLQTEAADLADLCISRPVAVLPYSYRLDAARLAAVCPALVGWLGPGLCCDVQPGLPLGAEDKLATWLPPMLARLAEPVPSSQALAAGQRQAPALLVLLFALTATPERESHGALVQALVRALTAMPAPRPQLRVAVDESGYRQRLAGPDGAQRLAQRRAAWEALLMGLGVVPGFIDLAAPAA